MKKYNIKDVFPDKRIKNSADLIAVFIPEDRTYFIYKCSYPTTGDLVRAGEFKRILEVSRTPIILVSEYMDLTQD